jgi:hypothetical protein
MRSIIGLVLIASLAALDDRLFRIYSGTTYLDWYVRNGALIALVTALASMTWADMKGMSGMISAHPLTYMRACLHVIGLPLLVLGAPAKGGGGEPRSLFDTVLTIPLVLFLVAILLSWLVVVAPLQYFVYLMCGAPARIFARSTKRTIARVKDGKLDFAEAGKEDKIPDGWWDASIAGKPVTSTNLFATMLFVALRPFLG